MKIHFCDWPMSQKSTYKCTFLLHIHVKLKRNNENQNCARRFSFWAERGCKPDGHLESCTCPRCRRRDGWWVTPPGLEGGVLSRKREGGGVKRNTWSMALGLNTDQAYLFALIWMRCFLFQNHLGVGSHCHRTSGCDSRRWDTVRRTDRCTGNVPDCQVTFPTNVEVTVSAGLGHFLLENFPLLLQTFFWGYVAWDDFGVGSLC